MICRQQEGDWIPHWAELVHRRTESHPHSHTLSPTRPEPTLRPHILIVPLFGPIFKHMSLWGPYIEANPVGESLTAEDILQEAWIARPRRGSREGPDSLSRPSWSLGKSYPSFRCHLLKDHTTFLQLRKCTETKLPIL